MAIRRIIQFPDPQLNKPSLSVDPNASSTKKILDDLADTMYASPGVGLAASQIGILKRLSVIDIKRGKKGDKKHIVKSANLIQLINPILLSGKGQQIPREGCLSVPDLLANVKRYKSVKIQTDTIGGGKRVILGEGFLALALQHEIDHTNGTLFLDRVSDIKTDVFRRKTY